MKKAMSISGITWSGPAELAKLLGEANGFILHHGALHVRGICQAPEWHSLRSAWTGTDSFQKHYPKVLPSDIPFAQDQFGDQFLWRKGKILRLLAETGDFEAISPSLDAFMDSVTKDIQGFLNVSLKHQLPPGELIVVYPPYCMTESAGGISFCSCEARQVIQFHADLAAQIRNIPDGGTIHLKIIE